MNGIMLYNLTMTDDEGGRGTWWAVYTELAPAMNFAQKCRGNGWQVQLDVEPVWNKEVIDNG